MIQARPPVRQPRGFFVLVGCPRNPVDQVEWNGRRGVALQAKKRLDEGSRRLIRKFLEIKTPGINPSQGSAEADLGQDALAGQELGAKTDDEAEHGQTTIPGLSEVDKTEAGIRVSHRV